MPKLPFIILPSLPVRVVRTKRVTVTKTLLRLVLVATSLVATSRRFIISLHPFPGKLKI